MRILGIDPGSVTTGFGVVEDAPGGLHALTWGAVRTTASHPLPERLKRIYDALSETLRTWAPEAVAVERVFFADNPKTALVLGHARGVALLTVANAALPLVEYSALEIKQAVVGYGRADKTQVQQMVRALLRLDTLPQPADAADALAAAICHAHTHKFRRKVSP
ncbi:MAG: crossover junction endodeoxyribonuclease RuvC [Candidatus Tectomicrobia bacterium]|uniref:Crossover junction endodeoxyribonuclease RuvC n=1 Tax=Tectimicrobiota bacterium TaxID=2528274 RepID=A0A937W0H6_UNCTE|nr:crossover junction endodeoxyribonuclease RuvC [Candidatus Tectomicrobia bacterium]